MEGINHRKLGLLVPIQGSPLVAKYIPAHGDEPEHSVS